MTLHNRRTDELKALEDDTCELQMTPMIDVTFLLLIFFMCTLKFKVLEGTMGAFLPKDVGVSSGPVEPMENVVVRIEVSNTGTKVRQTLDGTVQPYTAEDAGLGHRYDFGPDRVIQYRVGPLEWLDLDSTLESLEALRAVNGESRFVIDPREGVIQDEVVQLLDGMIHVGITDVTFKGRSEK